MKSFSITRPRSYLLIFRKSRLKHIGFLLFHFLFFSVWYSVLLKGNLKPTSLMGLLFFGAPLMTIFQVFHALKVVMSGEVFTFDSDRKVILKDDEKICNFNEISRLQIRTISGSDGPDDHRLSIVKRDETKFRIEQSTDYDEIANAADDIADILKVEVVRKTK